MLEIIDSGVLYRNPRPHLRSVHAWHPSIVSLPNGELLAGFDLGEAVESLDYRTYLSRSTDNGKSWSAPQPLFDDIVRRRATHSVRLSRVLGDELLAFGGRYYRDDPTEGLVNRDNLGYVPMDLILLRSRDGGNTWTRPRDIAPPLIGPAFETCHRIIELADGRWLAPTSTWRGWNGDSPNGMQAIALVSYDRGETWPEFLKTIDQSDRGVISWEQGLTQLADGRLLAIVWSFDERSGKSAPNRYAISGDGINFSPPLENGMQGETAKLITLADGQVLCLYRRLDRPGLWGSVVRIEGERWIEVAEVSLWQGPRTGIEGTGPAAEELSHLKLGYPSAVQLPDGEVFVVFWCLEDCLHVIRWLRLRIT
jgi:sialidase-1